MKKMLKPISILLFIIHFFILYLWLFEWEKLYTAPWLWGWGISTLVGGVIYFTYYKKSTDHMVYKKLLLSSTFTMVAIAVLSFLVDSTVDSMP
ncbi:hypothetical protein [Priestia endophytica]|uniref:Uncharacterized protein n=1 Tax=Priestia endophytica DSM 13796 TaxID=1121089 RepID=A0A1I6ABS3_9BACI|nr:hypothetical protein [Priestia endophytica]KYG27337.1 hypothetical protein AZF06_14065 [Priestia endophytica]SFQ66070.1 hypothetical protein SAMN02745910_02584 [Priestia endophytica DSM 13796]